MGATKEEIEEAGIAVAAGAEFLDKKLPGWEFQINTRKLDLAHGCQCVLGQLAVDIVPRRKWLVVIHELKQCALPQYDDAILHMNLTYEDVGRLGFTLKRGTIYGFDGLTKAWKKLIEERLKDYDEVDQG